MLWETSLLENPDTSQQLGWQESRIPFVLSSFPISTPALVLSDKLFYWFIWGTAGKTLYACFCSLSDVCQGFLQLKPQGPSFCAARRAWQIFLSWTLSRSLFSFDISVEDFTEVWVHSKWSSKELGLLWAGLVHFSPVVETCPSWAAATLFWF